ncbi:MAG: arylesterase [Desulfobacula sp.]|nr:arylesterase [Desulfobacula sp.]
MKQCSVFFLLLVFMFSSWTGSVPALSAKADVKILILGDSLSAGLGVESEQAFPSLVQEMFNQKGLGHVKITNGSISGSTSAGAFSRLKWFLKARPDILVLALGANDGLRGLSVDLMTRNLDKTIVLAKEKGLRVILAGMKLPPNYGPEYATAFEAAFGVLAQKHALPFIPFLLKDVAGHASLNQADGIHPNALGHKIVAVTVFDTLVEQL